MLARSRERARPGQGAQLPPFAHLLEGAGIGAHADPRRDAHGVTIDSLEIRDADDSLFRDRSDHRRVRLRDSSTAASCSSGRVERRSYGCAHEKETGTTGESSKGAAPPSNSREASGLHRLDRRDPRWVADRHSSLAPGRLAARREARQRDRGEARTEGRRVPENLGRLFAHAPLAELDLASSYVRGRIRQFGDSSTSRLRAVESDPPIRSPRHVGMFDPRRSAWTTSRISSFRDRRARRRVKVVWGSSLPTRYAVKIEGGPSR